jgi:hypothetical protein
MMSAGHPHPIPHKLTAISGPGPRQSRDGGDDAHVARYPQDHEARHHGGCGLVGARAAEDDGDERAGRVEQDVDGGHADLFIIAEVLSVGQAHTYFSSSFFSLRPLIKDRGRKRPYRKCDNHDQAQDAVCEDGPKHGGWDGAFGVAGLLAHVDDTLKSCKASGLVSEPLPYRSQCQGREQQQNRRLHTHSRRERCWTGRRGWQRQNSCPSRTRRWSGRRCRCCCGAT